MSQTLTYKGLQVYLEERRAVGRFVFDARADVPSKGDSASWVQVGGQDIGSGWYVADVHLEPSSINIMRLTARQPGHNWTWADSSGDPLAPIEDRNFYQLIRASKVVDGVLELGYWNIFSNWSDDDNWGVDESDPLTDNLKTWEIEFVTTTEHQDWVHKKNGTWPTGLSAPVAGAGVYFCRALEIDVEPYVDPVTGTSTDYYRHFATFWEAPSIGAGPTQLTWVHDAW